MRVPKNTASRPQQLLELFLGTAQVLLCSVGIQYDRMGDFVPEAQRDIVGVAIYTPRNRQRLAY